MGNHEEGEASRPALTRARLASAALDLVGQDGIEALSMRGLAERLDVKAASLYWHVRDRRELIELLAESILDGVAPARGGADWRRAALRAAASLREGVARQKDADRILMEVPEALERSAAFISLSELLKAAGLQPAEASEVALMVMVHAITPRGDPEPELPGAGAVAKIAIDSGSRGVLLKAGSDLTTLVRVARDPGSAAPYVIRGETVVVRRLRGVGRSEIELNPQHPWRFQIQGPTWNSTLDLDGLDVREVKLDSGAAKVECFLPKPRGVVPIIVSGGTVGVRVHRPPGVAVSADISSGALRIKLDEFAVKAAVQDLHWETERASSAADRYELRISGGAVQLTLDVREGSAPANVSRPESRSTVVEGDPVSALELLLDGVEARIRRRQTT